VEFERVNLTQELVGFDCEVKRVSLEDGLHLVEIVVGVASLWAVITLKAVNVKLLAYLVADARHPQ